jgi:hypothetical protein
MAALKSVNELDTRCRTQLGGRRSGTSMVLPRSETPKRDANTLRLYQRGFSKLMMNVKR